MSKVEILITAIHERPALWDKRIKRYHNRILSHREWKTVAEIIGSTSAIVKKKWKNLRDTFAKEYRKVPKPQSGSDAEDQPEYNGTWPFYESMSFLKVVIKPRKPLGIFRELSSDSETSVSLNSPPIVAPVKKIEHKMSSQTRKIKGETSEASLVIDTPKKQLVHNDQLDDDDENFHWFKSILPYMKQLPPLNRLRFRTQMQQLLLTEISKVNTPQTSDLKNDNFEQF